MHQGAPVADASEAEPDVGSDNTLPAAETVKSHDASSEAERASPARAIKWSGVGAGGWGVWPGASMLPRSNAAPPPATPTAPATELAAPARGASGRSAGGVMAIGSRGGYDDRMTYQRKDRLLFLGKPPALLHFFSAPSSEADELELLKWYASHTVLLSDLQWWMNDCDVREAGRTYGDIRAVRIFSNPGNGASLGLALTEFASTDHALKALRDQGSAWTRKQQLNGGRPVRVQCVPYLALKNLIPNKESNNVHWVWGHPLSPRAMAMLLEAAGLTLVEACAHTHLGANAPKGAVSTQTTDYSAPFASREDGVSAHAAKRITAHDFRFPFAAAAVIAQGLLTRLQRQSRATAVGGRPTREQRELKRRRQEDDPLQPAKEEDVLCSESLDAFSQDLWPLPLHPRQGLSSQLPAYNYLPPGLNPERTHMPFYHLPQYEVIPAFWQQRQPVIAPSHQLSMERVMPIRPQ